MCGVWCVWYVWCVCVCGICVVFGVCVCGICVVCGVWYVWCVCVCVCVCVYPSCPHPCHQLVKISNTDSHLFWKRREETTAQVHTSGAEGLVTDGKEIVFMPSAFSHIGV